MKQLGWIVLGILIALVHGVLATEAFSTYLKMAETGRTSVLFAAEGRFYSRDAALLDGAVFLMGAVVWIGLLIVFRCTSTRVRSAAAVLATAGALGTAGGALFGDGIAVLAVFPLGVAATAALVRHVTVTKRAREDAPSGCVEDTVR